MRRSRGSRRLALALGGAVCLAGAACDGGGDGGGAGGFQDAVFFSSGETLPGTSIVADAVRALAVNDSRVAVIEADYSSPSSGSALVVKRDGLPPVLVVKTGDALPDQGGSGTSGNYEDVDPAYVILDASSRTLFAARYSSVNYNGIYRADADGQIECLVTIFDAVPGGVLTAFGGQLAASPSGRWIAFVGVRNDLSTGIFVWDDTTGLAGILAAATTATTVPGESVPFDDNWSGMSIDDSGELCFAGSSGASFHTWRWTAVGLVNLARTGEAMPLVAAETVDLSLAEGICASGKVTVRASAETTGSVRLFRFDATPAAEAVLIPGAGAPSGDAWLELVDAADVRTSAGGWVSFLGVETGSGQTVLAADGGGSAREVARIGGEVPGTSESITGIPRTRLGGGKVVYLASTAAGEYLVGQGSSGTDAVIAEPSATVTGLVDDCFFVSESGAVVYTAELVGGGTSVMTGE